MFNRLITLTCLLGACAGAQAQTAEPAAKPTNPQYEPERAKRLGASSKGMRNYVLVVLKTGPNKVPAGPERDRKSVV